jgi:hypothetical protein
MASQESAPGNNQDSEYIARLLVASGETGSFGPAVISTLGFVVRSGQSLAPEGFQMSSDDLEVSYEIVMARLSQSMDPNLRSGFARTAARTMDVIRQRRDTDPEIELLPDEAEVFTNLDLLKTALYNRFEDYLAAAVFDEADQLALEEILSQEVSAQLTIDSEARRIEADSAAQGEPDTVDEAAIYYTETMRTVEQWLQDRSIEAARTIAYYASQAENDLKTRSERRALDEITEIARRGYIDYAITQVEREYGRTPGLAMKLKRVLNDFVVIDTIRLIERGGEGDLEAALHNIDHNTADEEARDLTLQALGTTIFERAKLLVSRGRTQEARELIGICPEDTRAPSLQALNKTVLDVAIRQLRNGQHYEVVKNYIKENAYGSDIEFLLTSAQAEYLDLNPEN